MVLTEKILRVAQSTLALQSHASQDNYFLLVEVNSKKPRNIRGFWFSVTRHDGDGQKDEEGESDHTNHNGQHVELKLCKHPDGEA